MYEASIQCWFYIGPMVARLLSLLPSSTKKIVVKVGPPLTPRMSTYQKSLETVFSIAICRHSSDKLQSNSLLLTILSTFVDRINVLDCRLSDEPPSSSCWVCSIESPWRGFTYECPQHAEISLAWPKMSKVEIFFVGFKLQRLQTSKPKSPLSIKWHTWQNTVIE